MNDLKNAASYMMDIVETEVPGGGAQASNRLASGCTPKVGRSLEGDESDGGDGVIGASQIASV
jgi:hypothetical protein